MADLHYSVAAQWQGVGRDGQGALELSGQTVVYSAPADMGGKGVGTSPEELLLAAVTSCYSGTLAGVLRRRGLPARAVRVRTEGHITGWPQEARYAGITVHPVIVGGEVEYLDAYREAAREARDRCFIGRTVRDYLTYAVGTVDVDPEAG